MLTIRKERLRKLFRVEKAETNDVKAISEFRSFVPSSPPVPAPTDAYHVDFPSADATTLRGILLKPRDATSAVPVMIMAHGFSCTWRQGLLPFARACQAKNIAVLLFDHASYGESDGEPRCVVDWWGQILGYIAAVRYLCSEGTVDPSRVALFGFSLSGAQALLLGALVGIAGIWGRERDKKQTSPRQKQQLEHKLELRRAIR